MIPFKEIKEKAAKKNQEEFNKSFYFSSKFSIYLSYIFINIGLTPNQVTFIFFLFGLCGAILLNSTTLWVVLLSYFCFRMHIIIDLCDGEVARFTKKFSLNGAYYDYMIHSVLYPMFYGMMCYGQFLKWNDHRFLYIGMVAVLVASLTQAVKNNYFRALFFNAKTIEAYREKSKSSSEKGIKFRLYVLISDLLSFEGLFIGYIACILLDSKITSLVFLSGFLIPLSVFIFAKFYLFSAKGVYKTKS